MSDGGTDQAPTLLAGYTRQRDDLLARIVGVLGADVRVRSAWLSGSFGRGEADAWSDFDLHVAVEDEDPRPLAREHEGDAHQDTRLVFDQCHQSMFHWGASMIMSLIVMPAGIMG